MEHRLILGGEQYLPFARSCVAKLKKLGLPYANQSFEVDGVSIKVRIEPGHEYIRIEGGSVSMAMDSGVVDVLNFAPMNPNTFLPGVLHESGSAAAYNAPFVVSEHHPNKRKNPGAKSLGQLAGTITKGQWFKGELRVDARAESFAPLVVPAAPQTNPPTFADVPHDESLMMKKRTAMLCPPSIFTGRCRLYVQAMYGLPLYEYKSEGVLLRVNTPPDMLSETTAAPAIMINPYRAKDDTTEYPQVMIDTSCGVYLDPLTGKHWLFAPINGNEIRIYPMRSSDAGERLRHYLKADSTALSAVDKGHLEAYILAYSLPDEKRRVSHMNMPDTGGYYSMGYGWHWNWSGTTADIVVNGTYEQNALNSGMESTHFRLTPTPERKDTGEIVNWKVEISTVQERTRWAVYRTLWTIVEPDYQKFVLSKTTPNISETINVGYAPFYAFYKGDELQLVGISMTTVPAKPSKRTMSSGFAANQTYGTAIEGYTAGLDAGYLDDLSGESWHHVAKFSCGSWSSEGLPYLRTVTGAKYESTSKTLYDMTPSGFWSDPPWPEVQTYYGRATYQWVFDSYREEYWGQAEVVIPFYDAEAVYIKATKRHDTYKAGYTKDCFVSTWGYHFVTQDHWRDIDGSTWVDAVKYGIDAGSPGYVASSAPVPTTSTVLNVTYQESKLFCNAGQVEATFTHINEFHANELDEVGVMFETYTSPATSAAPIAYASAFIEPVNTDTPGVIVGWV